MFFQNEHFGWSWTLPPYDTLSKNTHIDCLGLGLKLLQMLQQIQLDTWYNMMQPSSSVIIRLFNTVHVAPATPPTLEPHLRRGPDSGREKRWNLAKTHRVKPALQELCCTWNASAISREEFKLDLSLNPYPSPGGSCSRNLIKAPGFSGNSKLKSPSWHSDTAAPEIWRFCTHHTLHTSAVSSTGARPPLQLGAFTT